MTTTQDDFEAEVRAMLWRRSGDVGDLPVRVPDPLTVVSPPIPAWRRPALVGTAAAAGAAVLAAVLWVGLREEGSGRSQVFTERREVRSQLPPQVDLGGTPVIFRMDGGPAATTHPDAVAAAYLSDRLPDAGARLVTDPATGSDSSASVRWRLIFEDEPSRYAGYVLLRRDGIGWGVTAATTDGVDLSNVTHDGGAVRGEVTSSLPDTFRVDVLQADSEPGPGEAFTDGFAGLDDRVGGGMSDPMSGTSVEVDVPVRFDPAVVRVQHVGGMLLSISEVAIDRPPPDDGRMDAPLGAHPHVVARHHASDAVLYTIDSVFGPGLIAGVAELVGPAGTVELREWTGVPVYGTVALAEGGWRIDVITTDGLEVEPSAGGLSALVTPAVAGDLQVELVRLDGRTVLLPVGPAVAGHAVEVPVPQAGWLVTRLSGFDGSTRVDVRHVSR